MTSVFTFSFTLHDKRGLDLDGNSGLPEGGRLDLRHVFSGQLLSPFVYDYTIRDRKEVLSLVWRDRQRQLDERKQKDKETEKSRLNM